jgi:hypothetical protein
VGSLRRSGSIRNSCSDGPRSRITLVQSWNPCARAVNFAPKVHPPRTEFLDAETGRQKPPLKCADAHRDQNPGIEWPEIPAETPYLTSYGKRAVCGDWNWRPTTQSSNRSPLERGTEIFGAETGVQNPAFPSPETATETTRSGRKPALHGKNARILAVTAPRVGRSRSPKAGNTSRRF